MKRTQTRAVPFAVENQHRCYPPCSVLSWLLPQEEKKNRDLRSHCSPHVQGRKATTSRVHERDQWQVQTTHLGFRQMQRRVHLLRSRRTQVVSCTTKISKSSEIYAEAPSIEHAVITLTTLARLQCSSLCWVVHCLSTTDLLAYRLNLPFYPS